jgi:uncharacterized protein (TIGR03067 family)
LHNNALARALPQSLPKRFGYGKVGSCSDSAEEASNGTAIYLHLRQRNSRPADGAGIREVNYLQEDGIMLLSVVTALCFLLPPTPAQADPQDAAAAIKEELKKLQGSWEIELQEEDGKTLSDKDLKGRTLCIGGSLFLVRHNASLIHLGKMKIDVSRSPKTLNAMVEKGNREGDILPGIYSLDGDTLKICLNMDGDGRPNQFKAAAKTGFVLMVCKRVRAKNEEGDLTGKYRSEVADIDGKKLNYDAVIERLGDAYMVTYSVQGKVIYAGIGLRKGDIFAISWMSQGQAGVTMYQIEKGQRMVGQFTQLGGPGFLGTEVLTKVLKEI